MARNPIERSRDLDRVLENRRGRPAIRNATENDDRPRTNEMRGQLQSCARTVEELFLQMCDIKKYFPPTVPPTRSRSNVNAARRNS